MHLSISDLAAKSPVPLSLSLNSTFLHLYHNYSNFIFKFCNSSMMWSSIENLKQNLNKIALDVHDDDDEELEMHASSNGYDSSVCNRRNSHRFVHSKSVIRCLVANGNGSPYNFEVFAFNVFP
ncbi:hypothetical protein OIU78_011462 [Salix suchowensis]|nr:hypothetical protein OIU78_011462 [Salix suchowensis]